MSQAKISLHRMKEILNINPVLEIKPQKFTQLLLNNVSYDNNEKLILSNINMTLKKGEKVALIGKSGSGKSTLRKIITGELSPKTGSLIINNNNYFIFSGMFNQSDSYIFDSNLKSNIILDSPYDESMYNSILNMCLINFIDRSCEDISNLSHGQKQKVALARSIYQGVDFLVLDESLSNIDLVDLNCIIENLIAIKNLTIIFITHNLSLTNKFDSVMLLKGGKLEILSNVVEKEVLV